jgi:carboxyl-terminal processing protease
LKKNKKEFGLLNLIIVIIVTAIVTSLTTGLIIFNNKNSENNLTNDENLQEFISVYQSVLENYYEDVDKEEMIEEAINAMLNYLGDDYTTYLNSSETQNLTEKLAGKYEGIGVELTDGNVISNIFDDSPAQSVGMQVGDIIIKINDKDVTTYTASEIANEIKNNSTDDKIKITVKRNEEELSFSVSKEELYIPAIESKLIDNNGKKTGYIYISTFSNTVSEQFKKELKELENKGMDNLIIDVRDNTGGYLSAATDIASIFLEKGKIIYSLEGKNSTDVYKDETSESKSYNLVVLINESSASASEILAAALKESYNATLVGQKSYGKGKVQQTASLSGGSMYKYTSAKWLTPNGDCIDKIGITPDYQIDLQIAEDGNSVIDTQLNKALELLGE